MFDINFNSETMLKHINNITNLQRFGVEIDEDKTDFKKIDGKGNIYFTVPKYMDITYIDKHNKERHVVMDSDNLIKETKETILEFYNAIYDEYSKELGFLASVILGEKEDWNDNFHFFAKARDDVWTTDDYNRETESLKNQVNEIKKWKEV